MHIRGVYGICVCVWAALPTVLFVILIPCLIPSLFLSLLDICDDSVALGAVHVASLPPSAHWLELLPHHTRHGQLQSGLGECCDVAHSAVQKMLPNKSESMLVTHRIKKQASVLNLTDSIEE